MTEATPIYREGICGDGAAILRDGAPVSISWIIHALESWETDKAEIERLGDSGYHFRDSTRRVSVFDFSPPNGRRRSSLG